MTGPEHYHEAERLLSSASYLDRPDGQPVDPAASAWALAAAQVHATLALTAAYVTTQPVCGQGDTAGHATHTAYQEWAHVIEASTAPDAPASAPLTVYRAEYDTMLGLYTTAAAARKRCETELRREWPNSVLDWIEDEEDGVAELVSATTDGDEIETGYVVTALPVASERDAEGGDAR